MRLAVMSNSPMPSALRSGGGSLSRSTLGPPMGEPLSAMYSDFLSGLTLMPRGRLPSGTVATTAWEDASITVRSPDTSLVTYTRTAGVAAADGVTSDDDRDSRLHDTAVPATITATKQD